MGMYALPGSDSPNVYWIADCPHEWLFQHVSAVVHHGGAGTTACGLRNGKPTIIVPFFGDQPFWGDMVAKAGAGPKPIPHKEMSAEILAQGIRYCLSDTAVAAAKSLASRMESEMGVRAAVQSFHRHLPLERLRCDLIPDQPAVWVYDKAARPLKLSKMAAAIILENTSVQTKHIKMYVPGPRHNPYQRLNFAYATSRQADHSNKVSYQFYHYRDDTLGSYLRWSFSSHGNNSRFDWVCHGDIYEASEEWRHDRRQRARDLRNSESQNSSAGMHHGDSEDKNGRTSLEGGSSGGSSLEASTKTKNHGALAGRMAGASAKSIGNFAPTALKGMMVDIPLAITEGLKSAPRMHGGTVRDNGKVTDAKSGAIVAGKTFARGFVDGFTDLVVEPYNGARKDGALGAVKGLGMGAVSLTTKSGAGMFGLLAYPTSGISKSLRAVTHSRTRARISLQRHAEGAWLVKSESRWIDSAHIEDIVSAFNRWGKEQ